MVSYNSEISIICVGTPSDDNGHLDSSYVFSVAKVIGKALIKKSTYHIVVIRSTTKPVLIQLLDQLSRKNL